MEEQSMMEGNDVYSLKNIIYMIKMCTYKGTEEQPRMQANDVDSLKHEICLLAPCAEKDKKQ